MSLIRCREDEASRRLSQREDSGIVSSEPLQRPVHYHSTTDYDYQPGVLSSSTSSSGDGEVVCLHQAPVTVHAAADAADDVIGVTSAAANQRRRASMDSTDRFVVLNIFIR